MKGKTRKAIAKLFELNANAINNTLGYCFDIVFDLFTLPISWISESCIEIKIK